MYIQYMLCPKQEFITEPAKPKMNPMFDDIKTWLNPTGILFQWAGSLRQSSSLTEVRWVVQWPPLLVSPPMLVSPIPTLWGPIPGT